MDLIGLTGHKGAGKDEAARVLARFGYTRVAFADPLKRLASVIGWDGSKDERPPCDHCGMLRGRQLLQVLGAEGVREIIDTDAWLYVAQREIEKHERVVVSDVRFPNEADFVRNQGGAIWKLVRPGHEGDRHASETELETIEPDATIYNGGSLDDLAASVGALLALPRRGRRG